MVILIITIKMNTLFGLNPHEFSLGYLCVNWIARFLLYVFFRKVHIVGFENVPKTGGLIVCGTHNNQFVDALVARLNLDVDGIFPERSPLPDCLSGRLL